MNGFTFTDIFDTKGIEYLIIIAFLVLIIPFWTWLNRPVKLKTATVPVSLSARNLLIPQGLFFSRNHTWASLEPSGVARIGLDDLLLKLTGAVRVEYLAKPNSSVKRGDPLVRILGAGKHLDIASPLSGQVESLHQSLIGDSGILAEDPYGKGWICRIRPEKWAEETRTAYLADDATSWIRQELSAVKDFIMETLKGRSPQHQAVLVLAEGGELTGSPLSEMDADAWKEFQEKFLGF
jgi:glycine cleavage system H protein